MILPEARIPKVKGFPSFGMGFQEGPVAEIPVMAICVLSR